MSLNAKFAQDIDDRVRNIDSHWADLPFGDRIRFIRLIVDANPLPVAVYATDPDRRYLLGYAYGNGRDIQAYYDDQKAYGLDIELIDPVFVPAGYADERSELRLQIKAAEQRLYELNAKLKLKGSYV